MKNRRRTAFFVVLLSTSAPLANATGATVAACEEHLGKLERAEKAQMITKEEYTKAFGHDPDCSIPVYRYMCQKTC